MAEIARFVVQHRPIARPRQRHGARIVSGADGPKARSFNYSEGDHPFHDFKAEIAREARQVFKHRAPSVHPIELQLVIYMPRTQFKAKRYASYHMPHTSRPDGDNIQKLVQDALLQIAFADDRQVFKYAVTKLHTAGWYGISVVIIEHSLIDWISQYDEATIRQPSLDGSNHKENESVPTVWLDD